MRPIKKIWLCYLILDVNMWCTCHVERIVAILALVNQRRGHQLRCIIYYQCKERRWDQIEPGVSVSQLFEYFFLNCPSAFISHLISCKTIEHPVGWPTTDPEFYQMKLSSTTDGKILWPTKYILADKLNQQQSFYQFKLGWWVCYLSNLITQKYQYSWKSGMA